MGTITALSLITKAQTLLQDATGVRWGSTELLGWLNDGQRQVQIVKINAYVKNVAVQLVSGTRQTMPDDAIQLFDIPRNMGTNGSTPGRAIRIAQREMLDSQVPNWHAMTQAAVVKHYTYNVLDPKAFYVYPPNNGTGYVDLTYGATPPDVAAPSNPISLDDIYATPLLDYMLYRAFSKDSEYADQGKANGHLSAFTTALTGKARMEAGVNPNQSAPATHPTTA